MKPEKYTFPAAKISRCIKHALAASAWSVWDPDRNVAEPNPLDNPSLLIQRDEMGVYLTSAGLPRDKLRNNKIYCVYAAEDCPQQLADKYDAAKLAPPAVDTEERVSHELTIPLSVGENGHCYEEYLAENFVSFVVTMPCCAAVEFVRKKPNASQYFANFDENLELGTDAATITRKNRRIQQLKANDAPNESSK